MRPSRYLLLSDRLYRNAAGRTVRFGYSARRAALFSLAPATAGLLAGGDLAGLGPDALRRLAALGAVVPEGEDELAAVLAGLRAGSGDPSTRAFTVMPTSYCNMACDYCGQEHYKSAADRARAERIARRVEAAAADPATRRISVTWFGGEPLLGLRVMRELSARFTAAADAAGLEYRARIATNGSLLTARTLGVLHDECRVGELEVTLDGPREVHDRRRLTRNGAGSYDRTVAALARAVREGSVPRMRVGIRVNVDAENEEHVDRLIDELAAHGLSGPQVRLDLMPVHSWGNDVSRVELEARRYAGLEAGWLRRAGELGIACGGLPSAVKRTTCHATTVHGEILDTQDRVYACSEHPLVPGARESGVVARLSALSGSKPRPRGMFDDWYDRVGDGRQQCGRCPLLPVCGGSCPKLWQEGHLPCPSLRFNWPERIDLAARRLGYRPLPEPAVPHRSLPA